MKKALRTLLLFILGIIVVTYSVLIWRNNQSVTMPDRARIQAAFDAAVGWTTLQQDELLNIENMALWWMLQQSAALTRDPALTALFERYHQKYIYGGRNIWAPMFYPDHWIPFNTEMVSGFNDYNLHFLYAISCDRELESLPIVQAQLHADYCTSQPWRPACATHQLMGLRFMQRSQCGDAVATQAAITEIQDYVVWQLTLDPRVVDVYIQRVLMLAESGKPEAIKPIWLERILNAQRADGGWAEIDPLLPLPLGSSLGFSAHGLSLGEPVSGFHTTAQGLLLMSLLLNPPAAIQITSRHD